MAWMKMLCDTYDAYLGIVGKEINDQPVLLPVSHSTVNAQIEVTLDEDGNFIGELSGKVEKGGGREVTIIPVTEDSAARSSGIAPHPLCDKLCYIAGDYSIFTKEKKSDYYEAYMEGLKGWVDSPYSHRMIQAVYHYLKQGTLIRDLLSTGILQLDEDGIFSDNVNKLQGQGQTGAVVRFRVGAGLGQETAVWKKKELYELYIQYMESTQRSLDLCYATGKKMACSEKHPSKVRNSGDKAKIISGNDESGFTYRGRFTNKGQAASLGYETSQKAHNALRWLLQKQGYTRDEAAIVAWEIHGKNIPDIFGDSPHAFSNVLEQDLEDENDMDMDLDGDETEGNSETGEWYARRLRNAINGYGNDFNGDEKVILLGLDAATTGRMSIIFYQEFSGKQFVKQVRNWHERCTWKRFIKMDEEKKIWLDCAPSPRDIALAAYGTERGNGYLDADKKLIRSTVERILPCIVNANKMIPQDIVRAVVNRASRPEAMSSFVWENQVMRIACALIKYNTYGGEKKKMKLDDAENLNDRSFLFGRLLAVLDEIEYRAMREKDDNGKYKEARMTNAKRYWNAYVRRPAKTYMTIKNNLMPYLKKLNSGSVTYFENLMEQIVTQISADDFDNKALTEKYLPGYYCQREEIRTYKNKNEDSEGGK